MMKVLVSHPNHLLQATVMEFLQRLGHDVQTARDDFPWRALECDGRCPDLIIVSLTGHLPLDRKRIRELATRHSDAAVMVIGPHEAKYVRDIAASLNVDAYLGEPVSLEKIEAFLRGLQQTGVTLGHGPHPSLCHPSRFGTR